MQRINVCWRYKLKVLFVGHHAHRNGAPIVLLNLLRWMKLNRSDISFEILLKEGGELSKDYRDLTSVELWGASLPKSFLLKNVFHVANRAFINRWRRWRIVRELRAKKFDLIYANTLDTTELIAILGRSLGIPCVCHVHELEYSIRAYCGVEKFEAAKPFISEYIAVAESVKENLIFRHKVEVQKVHVIPPPVDLAALKINVGPETSEISPVSQERFMVVGSGLGGWRKGTDIFLLIAKLVRDICPHSNIKFQWVGYIEKGLLDQYIYDLEMAGLQDSVEFTGQQKDAISFYRKADLFLLTSREDPFPLVCIESAALAKPLISFDSIGGMPQFINDNDAGSVVPYMSLDLMAREIIKFANDRALGVQKGINGSKSLGIFDLPIVGSKICEIITSFGSRP